MELTRHPEKVPDEIRARIGQELRNEAARILRHCRKHKGYWFAEAADLNAACREDGVCKLKHIADVEPTDAREARSIANEAMRLRVQRSGVMALESMEAFWLIRDRLDQKIAYLNSDRPIPNSHYIGWDPDEGTGKIAKSNRRIRALLKD